MKIIRFLCTWLILALSLAPASAGQAQTDPSPGMLDPTFSDDGQLVYHQDSDFTDLKLQDDGKILVAGSVHSSSSATADVLALRYHPDGAPDASFSGDGRIQSTFSPNGDERAAEILVQPDGKIVIVAQAEIDGQAGIGLIRFDANGNLDNSFSGNGKQFIPHPADAILFDVGAAVLGADNRIYVAGHFITETGIHTESVTFIAAVTSAGELDSAYGDQGYRRFLWGGVSDEFYALVADLAQTSAGEFVVVGQAGNGDHTWWLVVVFSGDGASRRIDLPEEAPGCFPHPSGICYDFAGGVEVQPNGKIVIVGQRTLVSGPTNDQATRAMHVMRLNPDFSLDPTFDGDSGDGNGNVTIVLPIPPNEVESDGRLYDVAIRPDGKIVAAGGSHINFAVITLNPDGTRHAAFGNDGLSISNITAGDFYIGRALKLAVQPDGKILAGGYVSTPGTLGPAIRYRGALLRLIGSPPHGPLPDFDYTLSMPLTYR